MNEKIDIKGLLPDFESIISTSDGLSIVFPPETAEQLSAFFVAILGIIFCFFLLISIYQLIKSRRQTSWVLRLLKRENTASITPNREELIEKAKKKKHQGAHLWLEFDESLIEIDDHNNTPHLYNTIDAHHFFNNSTLAAGITESRMLAAVPGFLTAVGVIGTFVGLQLGLSELNIGNDVAVSEMKSGLAHVISGAKIAFMTSVWGVTLSVLFNFIEKFLESLARKRIHKLQVRIDQIFPRLSAESQLQNIVESGQQSRESLQGLAEQIGEKMQESLIEVQRGIQTGLEESLQKIMAPAINKLVNETSDGNQKALESLVDKFLSRFGELGETQRVAMDSASESVSEALQTLNTSMAAFLQTMEIVQSNSATREESLIKTISGQVSQIVAHNVEQKRMLTEFVEKQLGGMSKQFAERDHNSSERDQKRQELFINQTTMMKESTESLLKRIDEGIETQFSSSKAIIDQGNQLQISITESINANTDASASLKATSNELKSASQEMKVFGSHIRDAGNSLSDAVKQAVESTSDLAQQNIITSDLMVKQREQMETDKQQIRETIEKLQALIYSADTTFIEMRTHQNVFLKDQKENVSELAKSMTKLLTDYSEEANTHTASHLKVWSEHTTNYASQMNNAVKALSSVVDEIEDKVGA